MGLHDKVQAFLNQDTRQCATLRAKTLSKTREALAVIEEAYRRYSDAEIALSYNGGKDCLVLLILLVAFLEGRSDGHRRRRIETVYVAIQDPFQEVDDFVLASTEEYGLDVVKIQRPMKEAFAEYLHARPTIRAILVGTRRNDPHGGSLSHFDETDHGWPKFMRVHPVINWEYAEVWDFLRALNIPYCVLYDRGYTSLGGTGDTLPNPSLCFANGTTYHSAWQLEDGTEERRGRDQAREQGHEKASQINRHTQSDSHNQVH